MYYFLVQASDGSDAFSISKTTGEIEGVHDELLNGIELAAAAEEKETHSFEIDPAKASDLLTVIIYSMNSKYFLNSII